MPDRIFRHGVKSDSLPDPNATSAPRHADRPKLARTATPSLLFSLAPVLEWSRKGEAGVKRPLTGESETELREGCLIAGSRCGVLYIRGIAEGDQPTVRDQGPSTSAMCHQYASGNDPRPETSQRLP